MRQKTYLCFGICCVLYQRLTVLLIGVFGSYFSEKCVKIQWFSFKQMHLKMATWFCPQSVDYCRTYWEASGRQFINTWSTVAGAAMKEETWGLHLMTWRQGGTFHTAGPLCGESTGNLWISLKKCQQRRALIYLCCLPLFLAANELTPLVLRPEHSERMRSAP